MFTFVFFKQKTAYEMRISDWSSDVCSSDLPAARVGEGQTPTVAPGLDPGVHGAAARRPIHGCSGQARAWQQKIGERGRLGGIHLRMVPAVLPEHRHQPYLHLRQLRPRPPHRSEEHTSELQSLMRTSYAVFCLQKKHQYYTNYLLNPEHPTT